MTVRLNPGANILWAINDPNICSLDARQELHGASTNKSDFFKIEKDRSMVLRFEQLLEWFDVIIGKLPAYGEDSRC